MTFGKITELGRYCIKTSLLDDGTVKLETGDLIFRVKLGLDTGKYKGYYASIRISESEKLEDFKINGDKIRINTSTDHYEFLKKKEPN